MAVHLIFMESVYWITGSQGFIGSHLAGALYKRGCNVFEARLHEDGISLQKLFEDKSIFLPWDSSGKALKNIFPSYILHFGAKGVGEPANSLIHKANYELSIKFFNFLAKSEESFRFLFAGTIDEYKGVIYPSESDMIQDKNLLAHAFYKNQTQVEISKLNLHGNQKFVHLRICNIFGHNQRPGTLLRDILNPSIDKLELTNVNYWRDYMWVEDLIHNLCMLMEMKDLPPILNIGTGTSKYMQEFVTEIWELVGKNVNKLVFPTQDFLKEKQLKPHMNNTLLRRTLKDNFRISSMEAFAKNL